MATTRALTTFTVVVSILITDGGDIPSLRLALVVNAQESIQFFLAAFVASSLVQVGAAR